VAGRPPQKLFNWKGKKRGKKRKVNPPKRKKNAVIGPKRGGTMGVPPGSSDHNPVSKGEGGKGKEDPGHC